MPDKTEMTPKETNGPILEARDLSVSFHLLEGVIPSL